MISSVGFNPRLNSVRRYATQILTLLKRLQRSVFVGLILIPVLGIVALIASG